MKKLSTAAVALSMFGTMLPSAVAVYAPMTAPSNGFIQAANPEWSSAHQASDSDLSDHRQYHRDAVSALNEWYAVHAADRGTASYNRARRAMLQERNMIHRLYHMGLTIEDTFSSSSGIWYPPSSSASSVSSARSSSSSSRSTSSSSSSSVSSSSSSSSVSSSVSSSSSKPAQASPSLGAASTFAVLAGSTVTNTGPTSVTGNLGVSAGTAVTGFGPGTVTSGAIHSADTLAGQAQSSLTMAYNDLAGRSTAPVSIAGNLGGMTLAPGLYKSTSGVEISSGDLTFDAKGDANAIFIIQIASTLNVSAGRQVILIDGAKAANIYWQVGTSANFGSTSVFKGSVLADQSISLQTGANIEGRLLARIGAVTMQSNTVVVPMN